MTRGQCGSLLLPLYESFIHYTFPVLTGALRMSRLAPPSCGYVLTHLLLSTTLAKDLTVINNKFFATILACLANCYIYMFADSNGLAKSDH